MPNAPVPALQEEVETYHADVKRLEKRISRDLKETTRLSKLLAETPLSRLETAQLVEVSDRIKALAGRHDARMARRYSDPVCC